LLRDDLLAQLIGKPRSARIREAPESAAQPLFQAEDEDDDDLAGSERESDSEIGGRASRRSEKHSELDRAPGHFQTSDNDINTTPPQQANNKRPSAPDSPDWSTSKHSDDDMSDSRPVTKKRKTTTTRKPKSNEDEATFNLGLPSTKYDLAVTKPGQITFLFEKISGSKL
jgi:hypothetical protein